MDDLTSQEISLIIKMLKRDGVKEIHFKGSSTYGNLITEYLDHQLLGIEAGSFEGDYLEKLPYRLSQINGIKVKVWNE